MAVQRQFECSNCDTMGKIMIRGDDITAEEIVYCPVCSSDIYEEEYINDEQLDDDMDT